MVALIPALYYSVVTWTMLVPKTFPNILPTTYVKYSFYPCLISVGIAECIGNRKIRKVVYLSIVSVFVTFLIKILIDLCGTIYHCACNSHWIPQECIEQNPVYYSIMISCSAAGTLLWICIIELRPFSGNHFGFRDKIRPSPMELAPP